MRSRFAQSGNRLLLATLAAVVVLWSSPLQAQTFAGVPALKFTGPFAGADALPQTLTINSVGAAFSFTTAASTSSGGSWLTVTTGGGCSLCPTPHAITAVVTSSAALAAGSYSGQIVLTSQSGLVTLTIPVTLTVASTTSAFLDNLPGQLSFSMLTNAASPPTSQPLQIRNAGTGTLTWNASSSTADGGSWLTLSATSGTAPSVVTVGIVVANLPNGGLVRGSFVGQVAIGASTGTVTVPIVVVVGSGILNQVGGISFTKVFGATNPPAQTVPVTSNGAAVSFSSAATNGTGGSWLTINACSPCGTPASITASIVAAPTLAAGTYTGQIVFTTQTGSGAITVPVTLTVAPAPPLPTPAPSTGILALLGLLALASLRAFYRPAPGRDPGAVNPNTLLHSIRLLSRQVFS
jgi:hypothetical protein